MLIQTDFQSKITISIFKSIKYFEKGDNNYDK